MPTIGSLTAAEIAHATAAFARAVAPDVVTFYEVCLHETFTTEQKAAFLSGDAADLPRRAQITASLPARRCVLVGHAPVGPTDANQRVVVHERSNVQPPFSSAEYALCEKLVVEHEPFRAACRARGIDPRDVRVDTWCVGWHAPEDNPSRRLAEPILYLQHGDAELDTLYAQPLEGFTLRLDLWATPPAVISFDVADAPHPPPPIRDLRFPDAAGEAARPPLGPLRTSQPGGPGFHLGADGQLRWQRWEATLAFTPREGAVLLAVRYAGRPVAWRLSFAEMVVPYGDPHHPHYRKSAFDAGEDGLGRNAHSLDPARCDCPPGAPARFMDAVLVNESGVPETIEKAVCVHEEDGGLLWKHLDWRSGASVARRGRRLVVMFLCTIANYTYGFTFRLGLDGELQMEATLTGILSLGVLPKSPGAGDVLHRPWGATMDSATGLYGPDHQHIFVARLDMAVDGMLNRVVEVEAEPAGRTTNDNEDAYALRHGRHNAFRRRATLLASESVAARSANPQTGRHWLIESCSRVNKVGEPTAWRLEPGAGSAITPACDARAAYLDRAGFAQRNLWVTAYQPDERFPAGDFPNQRPPSMPDGLAHWTRRDRSVARADVVLWHVFGVTHTVRLEDAPVMPCERVAFCLKPCGFFDTSPCVDVPCTSGCAATPRSRL